MDKTNFSRAATWSRTNRPLRLRRPASSAMALAPACRQMQIRTGEIAVADRPVPATPMLGQLLDESVSPIHTAPGRHFPADDWRSARRHCGVPATASFSLARGGLPDHPGDDVLSWRGPNRDGVLGNGAAGTPVRTGAGTEPDDVIEF